MSTHITNLVWTSNKGALVGSGQRPPIRVQPPPEFGGDPAVWTPEDLLVAANQSCLLYTLLFYVKQKQIEMIKHESKAEAVMSRTEDGLRFTKSKYQIEVWISSKSQVDQMREAFEQTLKSCPVKAACNIPYEIQLEINTEDTEEITLCQY